MTHRNDDPTGAHEPRPRQFSLSYLLMEIFWIALALGLTWLLIAIDDQFWQINTILLPAVLVVWGVAIGGLVGKMFRGAQFAAAIVRFGIILMLLRALLS